MLELFTELMNGCGPFWIANSVTATVLGVGNRNRQLQNAEENKEFQWELQRARDISQNDIEAQKIAHQRMMMSLYRRWQREERAQQVINMDAKIQLPFYTNNWPLALDPSVILGLIRQKTPQQSMNVIMLRTPLLAGAKGQMNNRENYVVQQEKDRIYKVLEHNIATGMGQIGDVTFRKDAGSKKENYTNADIMNIHFLMGSIPTLVIMPKYQDNQIFLSAAMWDEQATRPLIQPLFAMYHDPILARDDENYRNEVIEKLHFTISIITATIRDQYAMLTWGKQPTLSVLLDGNERMKQYALENKGIRNFLLQENESTRKALEANAPKLLEVYAQADVDYMLRSLQEQNKMLNA